MKPTLTTTLLALLVPVLALAQEVAEPLPSGALQHPEDEGLPWTYIVLVIVLIGAFFLLRSTRKELPSKRQRR